MKGFSILFTKSIATFVAAAAIVSMIPSSGYGGLLGSVAGGTVNVGLSPANYFDLSAIPGAAPVPALVVDPGVEYTGNQPALQKDFPGVTAHISADIGDHQILVSWINSGLNPTLIPGSLFTFDLFPPGQKIAGVSFVFGLPGVIGFTDHQITLTYDPIALGAASSTFGRYDISFVNVPEPGTYLLLGSMALVALFALRRREEARQVS